MATKTLGTNGTTTLTALSFSHGLIDADVASIQIAILNDLINGHPVYPGAFVESGLLYVPNRGVLQVRDGDYVGVDARGWPILVSADAIGGAGTSWTHS